MSLRIAYVASAVEGLEAFVYREIEALRARGHDVLVLTTKDKPGDPFNPPADWPWARLRPVRAALRAPFRLLGPAGKLLGDARRHGALAELAAAIEFLPAVRRHGAQALHAAFGDRKFFVAWFLKRLTGLPLTVTIHAHEIYAHPNEALFRRALPDADAIVTIAETNRRILIERYGVPPEKVRLMRLYPDPRHFGGPRPFTILTVGRFTERKGHDILFDALRRWGDGPPVQALVVGFGPLDVERLAREKGVADRVAVYPKLTAPQLRSFYERADVYCLPSKSTPQEGTEGIPVVLMEAMACGLPVVATRTGAVAELVDEVLVPESDPDALAAALRELARDPERRRALGERNRAKVARDYRPENLDILVDVWRGLTGRPPGA